MRVFGQAFLGAATGRFAVALLLAWLALFGLGPDYWVRLMTSWFADPLQLSLQVVRIAALLIGMGALVVLVWGSLSEIVSGKRLVLQFLDSKPDPATLFGPGGVRLASRAIYFHVNVSSAGRANLEKCSGRISQIERLDEKDKPAATLQGTRELIWAPRELGRIVVPIHNGGPQDLDVFRTVEGTDKLELLCVGHPPSWDTFLNTPGTYRLSINVSADGLSKSIRLRLEWRGKWNDFHIREI